jgi:hypothetical protein
MAATGDGDQGRERASEGWGHSSSSRGEEKGNRGPERPVKGEPGERLGSNLSKPEPNSGNTV